MNVNETIKHKFNMTWMMLKVSYGLLFIVLGVDKFLNIITNWSIYINHSILNVLPLTIDQFIMGLAIIEIIIGLMIITAFTRMGSALAVLWFLIIAIDLISLGRFYDIATRDIMLAIGAIALTNLTQIREMAGK